MKPKIKGNEIQFLVIESIYLTETRDFKINGKQVKDPDGRKVKEQRDKFIKEVYLKTWMDRRDVASRSEYVGASREKLKVRTRIYNRVTQKFYDVAHSMEEIEQVLYPERRTYVGFKPINDEI